MVAHRAEVPRVAQMEQGLVPAIEAMMAEVDVLVALIERRKVVLALQATHLDELYRRTQYWLTYVRMDIPSYRASSMASRAIDETCSRSTTASTPPNARRLGRSESQPWSRNSPPAKRFAERQEC